MVGFLKTTLKVKYPKYLDIAMEKVIKQEVNTVLDKIRAEIEQFAENPNFGDLSLGVSCGVMKAIEIIDKYKAESEEQAWN